MMVKTGIYHEKVAAEDNRYGIDDLNAKHKAFNLLGYELVEEKELPAGTTTCTFDNLDGDTDLEYLFEFDLSIIGSGFTGIAVRPNNITTNQTGFWAYHYTGNSGQDGTFTFIPLGYYFYAENHDSIGTMLVKAKTGKKRTFIMKNYIPLVSTHYGMVDGVFQWNELVSNITNFVIAIKTGGSFSGNIKLWKKLPLE